MMRRWGIHEREGAPTGKQTEQAEACDGTTTMPCGSVGIRARPLLPDRASENPRACPMASGVCVDNQARWEERGMSFHCALRFTSRLQRVCQPNSAGAPAPTPSSLGRTGKISTLLTGSPSETTISTSYRTLAPGRITLDPDGSSPARPTLRRRACAMNFQRPSLPISRPVWSERASPSH